MAHAGAVLDDRLQGVRERCMPDVVEQGGRLDRPLLFGAEAQGIGHARCQEESSQRMLHPGVMRPWEDKIGQTELVHAMQPLHLRAVHEFDEEIVHLYRPMHGIVDDLGFHRTRVSTDDVINSWYYIKYEGRSVQ